LPAARSRFFGRSRPSLWGSITGSGPGGLNEWPDAGLAVRALAVAGPSVPAIQATGYGPFCRAQREVIEPVLSD
jgi:hypothetical protein